MTDSEQGAAHREAARYKIRYKPDDPQTFIEGLTASPPSCRVGSSTKLSYRGAPMFSYRVPNFKFYANILYIIFFTLSIADDAALISLR